MLPVEVRGVKIGEGIPKVCVPIVGRTKEDILEQARRIQALQVDIVEWRADWFSGNEDIREIEKIISSLRNILKDKVILFTYRTISEGGNGRYVSGDYKDLYNKIVEIDNIDMIDVELFQGEKIFADIIQKAKSYNKKVIISNHDFDKTPSKDELMNRMMKMQDMNADIAKIAVMPEVEGDVHTLMNATKETYERFAQCPLVAISMGELGVISRTSAERFGSAITFGNVGAKSAPGQVEAEELIHILRRTHENIQISNK